MQCICRPTRSKQKSGARQKGLQGELECVNCRRHVSQPRSAKDTMRSLSSTVSACTSTLNVMAPTSDLNVPGQVFEPQFVRTFKTFFRSEFEEANDITPWLVPEPMTGSYHRAGYDAHSYYKEHALTMLALTSSSPTYRMAMSTTRARLSNCASSCAQTLIIRPQRSS